MPGKYHKTGSTTETKNYRRKRKLQPATCAKDSYRTKKTKSGFLVFCKSKNTGKLKLQSVAKRKR